MCFKRIKNIQQTVNDLNTFIKTKEYDKLKRDSLTLKEEQELLSNISFDVKNVTIMEDETGKKIVRIIYKQPVINLEINEETKEPYKNDTFYSINRLNLTSIEDMEKIQKVLKEIKNNY